MKSRGTPPHRPIAKLRRQQTAEITARQAAQDAVLRWRGESRVLALQEFARLTTGLKWNSSLLMLLLDELYVDDLFDKMIGRVKKLSTAQYAQAVAFAIGLRHSWRPDDLLAVARRLGVAVDRYARRSAEFPR